MKKVRGGVRIQGSCACGTRALTDNMHGGDSGPLAPTDVMGRDIRVEVAERVYVRCKGFGESN